MLLYPGRRRAELYTRQDSRLIVICIGKYNRRKRVDGVWWCRHRGPGKCFLVVVNDCCKYITIEVTQEWILPGSISLYLIAGKRMIRLS